MAEPMKVKIDREKIEKVIQVIRPAIQADNGDIELRDVDLETGQVYVELLGACVTCPASNQTLKAGVERILKDRVAGVTEVIQVGIPEDACEDPSQELTDVPKTSPIANGSVPETAVRL